jgi:hypothetical protein
MLYVAVHRLGLKREVGHYREKSERGRLWVSTIAASYHMNETSNQPQIEAVVAKSSSVNLS